MPRSYSGRDVGRFVEPLLHGARRFLLVASPWISPGYARVLVEKARSGTVVYVVTSDDRGNRGLGVLLSGCRGGVVVGYRVWVFVLVSALLLSLVLYGFWLAIVQGEFRPLLLIGLAGMFGCGFCIAEGLRCAAVLAASAAAWLVYIFALVPGLLHDALGAVFAGLGALLLGGYSGASLLLARRLSRRLEERPASIAGGLHVAVVPSMLMSHAKIVVSDAGAAMGSANLTRSGLWRNMETVTLYAPGESGEALSQFWAVWRDAAEKGRVMGCGAVLEPAAGAGPGYIV